MNSATAQSKHLATHRHALRVVFLFQKVDKRSLHFGQED